MGIIGYGAYIPEYRISCAEIQSVWPSSARVPDIQNKAVMDWDEDVITMAVSAAERAMKHSGVCPEDIESVYFATTTAPCEEKSAAAIVQTALGIPDTAFPVDVARSTRAGTLALKACLAQLESGQISLGLIIAADNRLPSPGDMLEFSQASGAVALLVGHQGVIARISGWSSVTSEFTTTWRPYGERFLYRHDDNRIEREYGYLRTVTKAGKHLLERMGLNGKDIAYLAASEPDGKCIKTVANSLGIAAESTTYSNIAPKIGDTGVASAFLGLTGVLGNASPGQKALVLSYGAGCGGDAFLVETTEDILNKRSMETSLRQAMAKERHLSYGVYAKRTGIIPVPPVLPEPISGFANQPSMLREAEYIMGLTGLQCKNCGSLNFPHRDYCVDCRCQSFDKVKLPRQGKLETFNIQYVLPIGPEEGPVVVGTARLECAKGERGGKVSSAMISCDPDTVHVGMPVELVFRRCGKELGLPKYGYKFKPLDRDQERGETCGA